MILGVGILSCFLNIWELPVSWCFQDNGAPPVFRSDGGLTPSAISNVLHILPVTLGINNFDGYMKKF
jgi:hypothetical protein